VAYNARGLPTTFCQLDPTKIDVIKSDCNDIAGCRLH
jgi:hypothetical protein